MMILAFLTPKLSNKAASSVVQTNQRCFVRHRFDLNSSFNGNCWVKQTLFFHLGERNLKSM